MKYMKNVCRCILLQNHIWLAIRIFVKLAAGLFAARVVPSCFLCTLRDRLHCCLYVTQATFVMEK